MNKVDYKPEYRRNLPHYQPHGATLFVTSRLAGSVPRQALWQLKQEAEARCSKIKLTADEDELEELLRQEQKMEFARLDSLLDGGSFGPTWLANPDVAKMVCESMKYRDGRVYRLDTFVVMPNHIHVVFSPQEKEDRTYHSLSSIMLSLKRWTAGQANMILSRDGQLWQHESYDHVVRDEAEWKSIIAYVLDNPVKAGLVEHWEEWPWKYLREEW